MKQISTRIIIALALMLISSVSATHARNFRDSSARKVVYDCYSVDQEPEFPGGETAMLKFINQERNYPIDAYRNRVQGRVTCGFVVTSAGRITDVEVLRGVSPSLDREAMRVINRMPAWRAGRLSNAAVPVYYILTIPFRL